MRNLVPHRPSSDDNVRNLKENVIYSFKKQLDGCTSDYKFQLHVLKWQMIKQFLLEIS